MAEILKPVELIAYQEGTIVSRIIAKDQGGTVTLFAFADGQEVSTHTAPFQALVFLLEGRAEVSLGQEKLQLAAGDSLLMPPGLPHALRALGPFKMMLTMLKSS